MLASQGWDLVCTDICPESLQLCQRRLPQAKCILVGPTDTTFPCAPNTTSLLLCMEVDPVSSSEWFVDEALRVLRRGGILVVTFLNKTSLRALFHKLLRRSGGERAFYKASYNTYRRRLLRAGFSFIDEGGCCWAPFTRDSNSSFVPLFVWLEKCLGLRYLPRLSPWVVLVAQKL